ADGQWRSGEVAILCRANRDADPCLRALTLRGIPFRFSGTRGLYDREEIRLLIAALRCIADPHDSLSLYLLSTAPFYEVPAADLAHGMSYANRKNRPLSHVYRHLATIEEIEVTPEGQATIAK